MSSPTSLTIGRFKNHRLALVSLVVLTLLAVISFSAPLVEMLLGVDGELVDIFRRHAAPSTAHPLGTDELGRDVLVRLLYGGRLSLIVAFITALVAACIGTVVGLLSGYNGGRFDTVMMRLTDGVIALPLLPLLIVLAAADPTKLGVPEAWANAPAADVIRVGIIISLVGWTTVARLVRGSTLSVKERKFVTAARALGAGPVRIMFRHILPNVLSPVIVATTLSVGNIILFESALSFLGLGIQPPLPSWGNMLSGALDLVWSNPALAVWPGLMIFTTVIAFNFLGDGLQDALDPRAIQRKR